MGRRGTIRSGCMIDAPRAGVVELGDGVDLNRHVYLGGFSTHLRIGARSTFNQRAFIDARGSVLIGEDVMVGPFARLVSYNHVFDNPDVPMNTQGFSLGEIRIGNDVWIGTGATILAGVTLGDFSIVAAGAVVTRSFPTNSILAGPRQKSSA
jgi:acetyltransferase-like isoleucine patch superfamily enzyme